MQQMAHRSRRGESEKAVIFLEVYLVNDEDILDDLLDISEFPVYSES